MKESVRQRTSALSTVSSDVLQPSAFDSLNVIHVAGTKGKGSTSAFISSILCQYKTQSSLTKVGLYTSPHLRSVRERIQINNEPLSETLFTRYFFEIWDRLETSAAAQNLPTTSKPIYFRFLTLVALHAYLSEGVRTAVIECGIGGEYDSTNIVTRPTVCAVTSLGIDHTAVLGNTIAEIAWHKAGIFKRTTTSGQVFTVDTQPPAAMAVLQARAQEKGLSLHVVPRHPEIASGAVPLGLAADFQKTNASLAVAVAAAHMRTLGIEESQTLHSPQADSLDSTPATSLPSRFRAGLAATRWGGRCETRRDGNITWHLDGGHTLESIKLAAEWFASCIIALAPPAAPGPRVDSAIDAMPTLRAKARAPRRILLFNQQTRDAASLAQALHSALTAALVEARSDMRRSGVNDGAEPLFAHILFSTNVTFGAGAGYKPDLLSINTSATDVASLSVQRGLADTWRKLEGECDAKSEYCGEKCTVEVQDTLEAAIARIRKLAGDEECVVLVTGSLHLVGGVLEVLETNGAAAIEEL